MVQFDLENVSRIARDAAREYSPAITVIGVVLSAGGSDYVGATRACHHRVPAIVECERGVFAQR